jgi:hypothetical protein
VLRRLLKCGFLNPDAEFWSLAVGVAGGGKVEDGQAAVPVATSTPTKGDANADTATETLVAAAAAVAPAVLFFELTNHAKGAQEKQSAAPLGLERPVTGRPPILFLWPHPSPLLQAHTRITAPRPLLASIVVATAAAMFFVFFSSPSSLADNLARGRGGHHHEDTLR